MNGKWKLARTRIWRIKYEKTGGISNIKIGATGPGMGCPGGMRAPPGPADDIVGRERRYFLRKLLRYPKLFLSLHPISPVNQRRRGAVL